VYLKSKAIKSTDQTRVHPGVIGTIIFLFLGTVMAISASTREQREIVVGLNIDRE
jgi:hypothetical protein